MRRRLLTLPLVLAAAAGAPAQAQEATMTPSTLRIGQTDRVTFTLALPAGRHTVTAEVPGFVRGRRAFGLSDPLDPYGTPFTPAGPPSVGAGATASGGGPGTFGLGNTCRRGFDPPADPVTTVTMPAGGGELAWGFWLSKAQRWSATDYRVAFRVRSENGRVVRVRPPAPVVRGRFGTRFRLRVGRAGGGRYRVTGSTLPVLARGRVSLMAARARDDASSPPIFPSQFTRGRAVVTLRTDGAGRFGYTWRPRRDRYYALWAATFTEGGRLGDSSCPLRIDTGS